MSKKESVLVTVKSEALANALNIKPGSKVKVDTKNGVPTDKYWRNRFKEAEMLDPKGKRIDNSLELPNNKAKKEPAKSASSSSSQEA